MTEVWKKLNLKDQERIAVVDAPDTFEAAIAALDGVIVEREMGPGIGFVLGFGTTLEQVERFAAAVADHSEGDVIVWFAYPKASSKRYRCEFNRDTGWAAFGDAGFEPVRQVAIDEDWSGLRFRRVEYIRQLTRARSGALTDEGRRRTSGQDR